jgi:hypothetical protein
MAKKNPALFIPVKVGKVGEEHTSGPVGHKQRESGCLGSEPGRRDLCAPSGSCFGHADPRMTAERE